MNLSQYEKWFDKYTSNIRDHVTPTVLDMVDMKITHTFRVCDHCMRIAQDIGLTDDEVNLAALIGLFHDLGRFRQALEYKTMNDRVTGSHADMSADIFADDVPKYDLTDTEISIITDALRYHNLLDIPQTDAQTLLFSQLIRDADKLDILDLFSDWEENQKFLYLAHVDDDCTPELLAMVLSGKNFKSNLVRNKNDCRLLYISMIYDLNFRPSFEWLLANDILEKFTGVADGTADADMTAVCRYVTQWIEAKLQA